MTQFSVLMSLYYKEKTEYARACFDSLLSQKIKADEWVIVEDGPLTPEMYSLLDEYQANNPGLIQRIPLKENLGLGAALNIGVLQCRNELIARMDTDDISRDDRFEKQLAMFERDPGLDICGTYIAEFDKTPESIVATRKVPLNDPEIMKYQHLRDSFNHMTVMYKKQAVIKAGNYQPCPLMEDTFLWVRMIQNGIHAANIPEPLVYVRIGTDMYKRRGGWNYYLMYREGRKRVLNTGFINKQEYYYSLVGQFVVALLPSGLRGMIFKRILHGR